MIKYSLFFILFIFACGPTIDENGFGQQVEPFSQDLIKKYPQFKLQELAFCIEGDFHFCLVELKNPHLTNDIESLIPLVNDIHDKYFNDYHFTETFIRTTHVELRFKKTHFDSNVFKCDTVIRNPSDTLINVN